MKLLAQTEAEQAYEAGEHVLFLGEDGLFVFVPKNLITRAAAALMAEASLE